MDAGGAVAIASALLAGAIYLIRTEQQKDVARLDGRINTHEAGCEQRQKGIDARLTSIEHTTERIDEKLDRLVERA